MPEINKALEDRRENAREAAEDGEGDRYTWRDIEAAIEVATRVKITEDIEDAYKRFGHPLPLAPNLRPALKAAFEAAGFEVVE